MLSFINVIAYLCYCLFSLSPISVTIYLRCCLFTFLPVHVFANHHYHYLLLSMLSPHIYVIACYHSRVLTLSPFSLYFALFIRVAVLSVAFTSLYPACKMVFNVFPWRSGLFSAFFLGVSSSVISFIMMFRSLSAGCTGDWAPLASEVGAVVGNLWLLGSVTPRP